MRAHGLVNALSSSDRSGGRAALDNDDECHLMNAMLRCLRDAFFSRVAERRSGANLPSQRQ